ncbi:hypothetical protein RRG08_006246 [Elysia crispata]|uniref:Uncharacterized protein n=1 Tax=Elysia crispata TaxID=231223 RepID=A0AAE0YPY9_9GAST|nr:hypothetical protein RRG08_006246 [Elysia crispata]
MDCQVDRDPRWRLGKDCLLALALKQSCYALPDDSDRVVSVCSEVLPALDLDFIQKFSLYTLDGTNGTPRVEVKSSNHKLPVRGGTCTAVLSKPTSRYSLTVELSKLPARYSQSQRW